MRRRRCFIANAVNEEDSERDRAGVEDDDEEEEEEELHCDTAALSPAHNIYLHGTAQLRMLFVRLDCDEPRPEDRFSFVCA